MPTQQSGFPTLTRAGLIATAATGQQNVATLTGTPYAGPGLGGCLTQNGDFSNGLTGWTIQAGTWSVDTTPADAPPGSATCVKVISTGGFQNLYQDIPALPGTQYTLGAYSQGDGTNAVGLSVSAIFPGNVVSAIGLVSPASVSSTTWTLRTGTFITPGNVVGLRIYLAPHAAMTGAFGRIGLVAGGTYADSQFSSNPLGNLSLVACEATTNLLTDGDCEGVGGTATSVLFTDPFANAAAWTAVSGSAPTAASNVLTIAAAAVASAGHPDWWDTQASGSGSSQMRFQTPSTFNSEIDFSLSFVDTNNRIYVALLSTTMNLNKIVGGVFANIVPRPATITAATSYWLTWSRSGTTVTANLCADGATPGAVLYTVSGTVADSAVQYGKIAVYNGCTAPLLLGQMGATAYAGVCQVSGPRPSAWSWTVGAGTPAGCWSKAQSFSGTYSLSINNNDAASYGQWQQNAGGIATYSASGRIKYTAISAGGVHAGLGIENTSFFATTVSGTSDWVPNSVTGLTPAGEGIALVLRNASGLMYGDALGYEALGYPTLNLDPFPAFYVPTGARAAAKATVPLPGGLDNAHAWTVALTAALPGDLANAAYLPDLLRTLDTNLRVAVTATGTLGAQLGAAGTAQTFRSGLVTKSPATAYRLVLAHDGAGTVRGYAGGVPQFTAAVTWATFLATLAIGNGTSVLVAGVVLANHAWSAAEVAADVANPNPPGLIANGGLFLQPGALYTQTPDASGNSLALPPPTGGRVVPDVIHVGVVRAGSLQPLAGQSTVGVQGAVFDAAGLLQAGGLKHISATVGTSQVAVAHGLGRVPSIILFFERSNATSWQSAVADGSNVYLTASVAGTSIDLYVS